MNTLNFLLDFNEYTDMTEIRVTKHTKVFTGTRRCKASRKYIFKTFRFNCISTQTQKTVLETFYQLNSIKNQYLQNYKRFSFTSYDAIFNPTFSMKYISETTLDTLLQSPNFSKKWTQTDALNCLFAVAEALCFLHKNLIPHGNLCPSNIIVDIANQCYVCDFGLYPIKKIYYESEKDIVNRDYHCYSEEKQEPTFKDDVYSFGVLMCQLHLNFLQSQQLNQNLHDFLNSYDQNKFNKFHPFFKDLIPKCLNSIASKRPTFSQILDCFQKAGHGISTLYKAFKKSNYLENLANKNDIFALNKLGTFYDKGDGKDKDNEKALNLYQKAASLNNSDAQNNLGVLLQEDPEKTPSKLEKGANYLKLSAEQGNMHGMANYGVALKNGDGVEIDLEKAKYYLKKSADLGYSYAQVNYGFELIKENESFEKVNEGLKYMKMAMDQNEPDAFYSYGCLLYDGIEIEKDLKLSMRYFKIAADLGYETAIVDYADMCYTGVGTEVEVNLEESLKYYLVAKEKGIKEVDSKIEIVKKEIEYNKQLLENQTPNKNVKHKQQSPKLQQKQKNKQKQPPTVNHQPPKIEEQQTTEKQQFSPQQQNENDDEVVEENSRNDDDELYKDPGTEESEDDDVVIIDGFDDSSDERKTRNVGGKGRPIRNQDSERQQNSTQKVNNDVNKGQILYQPLYTNPVQQLNGNNYLFYMNSNNNSQQQQLYAQPYQITFPQIIYPSIYPMMNMISPNSSASNIQKPNVPMSSHLNQTNFVNSNTSQYVQPQFSMGTQLTQANFVNYNTKKNVNQTSATTSTTSTTSTTTSATATKSTSATATKSTSATSTTTTSNQSNPTNSNSNKDSQKASLNLDLPTEELIKKGDELNKQNLPSRAFIYYRAAADKGDSNAYLKCASLAPTLNEQIHYSELAMDNNVPKSFKYWRCCLYKEAKTANQATIQKVARLFERRKDYSDACCLYLKVRDKLNYKYCYEKALQDIDSIQDGEQQCFFGYVCQKEGKLDLAMNLFQKSLEQNYSLAQSKIDELNASMQEEHPKPTGIKAAIQYFENGEKRGEKIDYDRAFNFFEKASFVGSAKADFYLGKFYQNGYGTVEVDLPRAVNYYRLSSNEGDVDGQCAYADCLRLGIGVEKNLKEAIRIYKLAADKGFSPAAFKLGRELLLSSNDKKAAGFYLKIAAADLIPDALYYYSKVIKDINPEDAKKFREFAIEKGCQLALNE